MRGSLELLNLSFLSFFLDCTIRFQYKVDEMFSIVFPQFLCGKYQFLSFICGYVVITLYGGNGFEHL